MTELERIAAQMLEAKLSVFDRGTVKGIIEGYCGEYVSGGVGDDGLVESIGVDIVRAVVTAMREPTEFMVLRGNGVWWGSDSDSDSRAIWPAMIDAILGEKPE